ncbi:MAG TPA: WD40 repeat domain-containing protein [Polyangiaceae bacterium]
MPAAVKQYFNWLGVFGLLAGCGGAPSAPAEGPVASPPSSALVAAGPQPAPPPAAAAPQPGQGALLAPAPVQQVSAFGKVIAVEQWLEPWSFPALRPARFPKPQRYERWRQLKQINVGFSHLSMAELSDDDQYLMVVSENEAKLRIYQTASGKLLSSSEVTGYSQFGRGTFMWQPGPWLQPSVIFANDGGIRAIDPPTGVTLSQLSEESAWQLRGSDNGAVLGANLPNIDNQSSILVFYAWRPDGKTLVPALALRFAERVDGFDLSMDNTLLAVSLYPSDTVQLLDLRSRRLMWSQPAPKYVSSVDISPDGTLVAVGGDAVVVYDSWEPTRQSRFTDLGNNVHQVRFSPTGDALAASAYDGKARILQPTADGAPLKLLKLLKHTGTANVYAVTFSSTGDRLVTSSGDKTLRIWGE